MRRFLVVLILILAAATALPAEDAAYGVLVYPQNAEIESFIINFFPEKEYDSSTAMMLSQRAFDADKRSLGLELNKAYAAEDEAKIESAAEKFNAAGTAVLPEGKAFPVVLLDPGKLTYDSTALAGDPVLMQFVCDATGADLLVIPVSGYLQGFRLLSIYIYEYGSGAATLAYEAISVESDRFPVRAALSLAPYFMSGVPALVRFDDLAVGAVVTVDGKEASYYEDCVMTTAGLHTISLSAQGKQNRTFATELEGNTLSSVSAAMKDTRYSGLAITSEPQATVLLDGVELGTTPLALDSYVVPSSLRLSAEGYLDKTVGLLSPADKLDIQLKPQWMADQDLFRDVKDGFYKRFAISLVIFGAKVALKSFNDGTNNVLMALDGLASAALAVSFSDLIGSLVDYYRQTEYIAP